MTAVKSSADTADTVFMPSPTFQLTCVILAGLAFLVVTLGLQALAAHVQITRQRQTSERAMGQSRQRLDAADSVADPVSAAKTSRPPE